MKAPIIQNLHGKTYGEHREFLEFDKEQYLLLKQYANELSCFSTAFDKESVDFLCEIDIAAIKIASGDITIMTSFNASIQDSSIVSTVLYN